MPDAELAPVAARIRAGGRLTVDEAALLYTHASDDLLSELATAVRDRFHPPRRATWLIMAIVNYTNVCVAKCDYCAFYRLPGQDGAYLLDFDALCARIDTVLGHGGTLVGFNGGFHPDLRVDDYAELFGRIRARYGDALEFYGLTVAELMFVCKVSKVSYAEGAARLRDAGLRWITGGGAEILDDRFRRRHSPLKYKVEDYYAAQAAILDAGLGSTATMVIGFDETLDERLVHLDRLRRFQDAHDRGLASFLCWTYKPFHTELGGAEVPTSEYLRWLAISRIFLDNIVHIRTSVLTKNEDALEGLRFGADDFDLPTEDEVTEKAGATISLDFERILDHGRALGFALDHRGPWPLRIPQAIPDATTA
ncbi:MAG: radical SAM protein [Alphaproteobacteria bacterium]|nr:radical SAM protein [Alphaproteobacteria bacterium]